MASRPSEAWRWWIDGLVDAVLLGEERLRRRRPVRFVPVGDGFAIVHGGGRLGRTVLRSGGGKHLPRRIGRALGGRAVELVVREEATVIRRLGPLPPESRAYVGGIVAHQLERMTPWPAADTLAHHSVEPVGADDPRLMVTVTATSRAMHAEAIAALSAAGPEELRLVRPATAETAEVALPIAVADGGAERERIGRTVMLGLAALLLVAAIGSWWYVTAAADLDAQVSEIEERLDGYRRRTAPSEGGAATSDRDLVAALSRDTPMSVVALENLSAALPDDTHLTALQIARGKLRLSGITRDVAALTTAIEASAAFAEPVFSAPTVRSTRGDRFTLDLRVGGAEVVGR